MGETLGIVHSATKSLSVHRPVKLEKKLSAFKIQWSDTHRTDIPILKGRK